MAQGSQEAARSLADRLRALRRGGLAGQVVPQKDLASALSVSAPLISSWENVDRPVLPPIERINAYAQFFATARSVTGGRCRLVPLSQLTDEEEARRKELARELSELRVLALGTAVADHPGRGDGRI